MVKTAWPSIEHVSGQSTRLGELMEHVVAANDLVQENLLQKKYKRSFCDRTVKYVVLSLFEIGFHLTRCKFDTSPLDKLLGQESSS
jgi:hypothetical protein